MRLFLFIDDWMLDAYTDILRFYRRHGFEPWGVQLYLVQTESSCG